MKQLLLALIRMYQKHVSPAFPPAAGSSPLAPSTRQRPFPSMALCRGGLLALWRLLRCNPFNKGDIYDPVP